MEIQLPELSLIALIGASSSGKSTFARQYFKPTEVISSDYCRAMVSDDENDQSATTDAFELLYYMVNKRLDRKRLTVIDATNVQDHARQKIIATAKKQHVLPVAIVFNLPVKMLQERHAARPDRNFSGSIVKNQSFQLRKSLGKLKKEGFRRIYIINSEEQLENITITRQKLWNDKKHITGSFDIIGDIHGCHEELLELLNNLGYTITKEQTDDNYGYTITSAEGRKVIFVGDIGDRGPNSPEAFRIVMSMVKTKMAYCVRGNHDDKLFRKLSGRNVSLTHGLDKTVADLEKEPIAFQEAVRDFLKRLVSHYVFDNGNLVVAHAGLREQYHGRTSGAIRSLAMYGETTGERTEEGFPVRINWGAEYRGRAMVVYGHTVVSEARWQNNTIDIDTGCCFGNKLTALRYPERALVSVAAKKVYKEYGTTLKPLVGYAAEKDDGLLHLKDVIDLRRTETRLMGSVGWREPNAIAALETMSRFAIDPRWLIYLPPTMSPTETSSLPDYLEYPTEAFDYYKKMGVSKVICQEKHMGSRAVVIICKDKKTVETQFGIKEDRIGICYTRTGRNFFKDKILEKAFLERIQSVLTKAKVWENFDTSWIALDCELMPWSAKAMKLLETQYAAVGTASKVSLAETKTVLEQAATRGLDVEKLTTKNTIQEKQSKLFRKAYRQYCWEVVDLEDYKLAPFHILATEHKVYFDKSHQWHSDEIAKIGAVDPKIIRTTPYRIIDVENTESRQVGIDWWLEMTGKGGEGMVIKPMNWIQFDPKKGTRVVQPALKCRGREYLRIIYGLEYTSPAYLKNLKSRNVGRKRSLAQKEFSLGVEGLERFVGNMSVRRVHECVFGVLALESEAVDPRL